MLLSDFNALGPISMPTPPTVALIEFFHADTVASIHPLPVSWYLISSLCVYLCSCMHIMSILSSTANANGSWPILFKVLTLNVTICFVCLRFSSFCCLSSVADFSNTEARAPTSAGRAPFFTCVKSDAVYVCGLSVGHGYLSMAVFILIYKIHCYRWAAVVPRSNWWFWALSHETHMSRTRFITKLSLRIIKKAVVTSETLRLIAIINNVHNLKKGMNFFWIIEILFGK